MRINVQTADNRTLTAEFTGSGTYYISRKIGDSKQVFCSKTQRTLYDDRRYFATAYDMVLVLYYTYKFYDAIDVKYWILAQETDKQA